MGKTDYTKRIITELTGHQPGQGKTESLAKRVPVSMRLAGLAAVGVITLGIIVWSLLPYGKTGAVDCAFRIPDPDGPQPAVYGDAVVRNTCVELERVVTNSARTLGLSNRPPMPSDRGMLFVYETTGEYCMWMKDMRFSLDMLWLNSRYEIVSIKENVTPDTYPRSFCGPADAQYVVEVNAGIIKAADLRLGQRLNL